MLKYTARLSHDCSYMFVTHKLHGTQYTPQFETLFTTTLLNI